MVFLLFLAFAMEMTCVQAAASIVLAGTEFQGINRINGHGISSRNGSPTAFTLGAPHLRRFRKEIKVRDRTSVVCTQSNQVRPLERYIKHFQVESAVQVDRIDNKGGGWGLRASRDIRAGQVIVALPRRAVLEVRKSDCCPWSCDHRREGVDADEADQVWRTLPLYFRLALALLDISSPFSAPPDADFGKHADAAALQEYLTVLPQRHMGALSWTDAQLLELQDAWMIQKVKTEQALFRAQHLEISRVLRAPPTDDSLMWALQTVLSRAFGFASSDDADGNGSVEFAAFDEANVYCLLPLIGPASQQQLT